MPTEHLPERADFRRLAARHVRFAGSIPLARFSRLAERLVDTTGQAWVAITFLQDEDGRYLATGTVTADLRVLCERCLEPMLLSVAPSFRLAAVWSEDEAAHLAGDVDPWVVGEDPFDVADLIEEELLLALPIVCHHDTACGLAAASGARREAPQAPVRENPFKALEALRKKP